MLGLARRWLEKKRGGEDPKLWALRLALRALPLRRRMRLGDFAYTTVTGRGASLSVSPYKGLTVLLKPGKTPIVTVTVPGRGTYRYRLPGPKLAKLPLPKLLDHALLEEHRALVEQTLDRFYPGIDAPPVAFTSRPVGQIARFEIEPVEQIIISKSVSKRLGKTTTAGAVRREAVRAGLWFREGVKSGRRFEDELRRVGEYSPEAAVDRRA
jgi:hypothetical protein